MKYLLIILSFAIFAHAEDEGALADSIDQICNISEDGILSDKEEDCMLYYVNCVIGPGGKWDDKQLFKCMKERENDGVQD